ncbi:hypothetical protein VV869_23290 [Photobacterium sp. MCCC 1A19761]|uniref:hypothetical protein n=1 Tax=Photobacterium sp. MCCC 1A19761 TaxID=3115000 RepID=UPI00307DAE2C
MKEITRCARRLGLNLTTPTVQAYLAAVAMCSHLQHNQIAHVVNLFFVNPDAIFKAALQNTTEYRQSQIRFLDFLLTLNSANDPSYQEPPYE